MSFGFASEIQSCSAIPLREVEFVEDGFQHHFLKACKGPDERLCLSHDTTFLEIKRYLSSYGLPENVFLYCEFGWSVYFNTFGDRDPTQVKPELIHIREGIPMDKRIMEREMVLCDGAHMPGPTFTRFSGDNSKPIRDREYVPRSLATASCTEFWSTGAQAFEYSMCHLVTPKQEWREHDCKPRQVFSYCRMSQKMLWETFTTAPCDHSLDDSKRPIKLGMDAAAVLGWKLDQDKIAEVTERFQICLTKGEPGIRWLAAAYSIHLGRRCSTIDLQTDPEYCVREVILRIENCCDSCALEQTAEVPGNYYWILIL